MLKINILGCGSSVGVPVIGCKCHICKSSSNYNKRLRSSIIINKNNTKILVDFGFDIKRQLIQADINHLDGAILTHDHADHVSGIDELRVFFYINKKPLDIFVEASIADAIYNRYRYLFIKNHLKLNIINEFDKLKIGDINLQLFPQEHGEIKSLGVKVDNFVYSCDVSNILPQSKQYLKNLDMWVVDSMDHTSNFAHAGIDKILEWNKLYQPKKIYLTNMSHNIDYHKIITELPENILPCYDGLILYLLG